MNFSARLLSLAQNACFLALFTAGPCYNQGAWAVSPDDGSPAVAAQIVSPTIIDSDSDAAISPAECFNLTFGARNSGSSALTNVVATVTPSSPQIQVTASPQPIATLHPGVTLFPLSFSLVSMPTYPCYTNSTLTVIITADQGVFTQVVTLPAAELGVPATFTNVSPQDIPDNNATGVTSEIAVSGVFNPIARVKVKLHFTHTYVGDLSVQLESPDGTMVDLISRRGGDADNIGNSCVTENGLTILTDSAQVSIAAGVAPFIGSFLPEQPLSALNGKSGSQVNGTWKLHARDYAGADVGTLQCWGVQFFTLCPPSAGQCSPAVVSGKNSINIENGDIEPSPADGTDFGTIVAGTSVSQTFTIHNASFTDSLNLTGTPPIQIPFIGSSPFSVTGPTSTSIPPTGTASFTITFSPTEGNTFEPVVLIPTSDPTADPFTFDIRGKRCLMAVSQDEFNMGYIGSSATIDVSTNCSSVPEPSHPWITIRQNNSDMVEFEVDTNPGAPRTGTINLSGKIITVNQGSNWQKSGINSGPEWFFDPESQDDVDAEIDDAGIFDIIVRPSTGRLRILGWQHANMMRYDAVGPDKFVRGDFHIFTSNAPAAPVNEVPNFRIRLQNEGAVVANTNYSHSQTGNGGTPHEPLYSLFNDPVGESIAGPALRPSSSSTTPSIYRVDFDPVDVPAADRTAIWAAMESFATANTANGTLSLAEVVVSTYPALDPGDGTLLFTYNRTLGAGDTTAIGGAKTVNTGAFNYEADFQAGRRQALFFLGDGKGTLPSEVATVSEAPGQGILLDTLNTPADKFSVGIVNLLATNNNERVRISSNKLYMARFYATSAMPTTSVDSSDTIQGSVNFSLATAGGAVASVYAITGAQNAGFANDDTKRIAVQALPGSGSQNPLISAPLGTAGEFGGWYTVLLSSPLNSNGIRTDTEDFGTLAAQPGFGSPNPSARDIIIGALVLESAATLKLSPTYTAPNAQPNRGKIRITHIALTEHEDSNIER